MNKIKTFFQENSWVKYLVLILICLIGLWWLSTGSFWTGKEKESIKTPVVTTPPTTTPVSSPANICVSCEDHDKKVMEEAQKISDQEITYLKRVEKLSGVKIFGQDREVKTKIKYISIPPKNCLTCQTTPNKKISTPTKGEEIAQYEHMGTPSLDGLWIEVWNPIHTKCIYFPHNKGGIDAIKDFVVSHHGDWESSKSNFPSRESLPDL